MSGTMDVDRDREEFIKLINELKEKVIVVEGKKDEKALSGLGLKNIVDISGKPLFEVALALSRTEKEIVILTDFDREGRKLAERLNRLLRSFKKRPNSRLRSMLMRFGKNKIEDFKNAGIEMSLEPVLGRPGNARVNSLKEVDVHGKTCSNFDKVCDKSADKSRRDSGKAGRDWRCFWPDRRLAWF